MSRILDVYLKDKRAGKLIQESSGELSFAYDADYINTGFHGISIAFPLQSEAFKGAHVKAFFSGLLPESGVRERLARYLGLSENNTFALLEAIGGDCAGALALYPVGKKPSNSKEDIEALDGAQLKEILSLIRQRPMLAGDDGYRLSLAGAQDKLVVRFKCGEIYLVKGGAPTTHILKPIIEGVKDSAHNELFCMKLANSMGIDVPEASLHFAGDMPFYLVERYDRKVVAGRNIIRIHQEDFCQALGMAPEIKYEREGGPSIAACQNLILNCVAWPAVDQIKYLNIIIFNYLIGNADAHGKNFSLLYKDNKPELAPAYDLLSTAIYPSLSEKMAMKIGGKYKPQDVCLRHFHKIVPDTRVAKSAMEKQIQKMSGKIVGSAQKIQADLMSEGLNSDIFAEIIKVIEGRVSRLKR